MKDLNKINELSYKIRGCIFNVYNTLGPGLMELVYEKALMCEFNSQGIKASEQVGIPVIYKGIDLGIDYRMDIVVEDTVVLELKSVEHLLPVHFKQLKNYLHLTQKPLGLLINFNTDNIDKNIHRIII
ncbi:MAG: GxxExxY protein [Muribaculaceae bacterium]|nr:GxxExxY protein [Muribaculaceae bacterium]